MVKTSQEIIFPFLFLCKVKWWCQTLFNKTKQGPCHVFLVHQERTVEISFRLTPKQLEHVTPVLEEIIHEIVEERQKGLAFVRYKLE